jgi:phosphate transport system substrate-binding protein
MNAIFRIIPMALIAAAAQAGAQTAGDWPPYERAAQVSGLLRSCGSEQMAGVLKRWEEGFARRQPAIQFLDTLKGTQTAQAGLYCGTADLALMEREILPLEVYPLFRRRHYFPFEIAVATGSAAGSGHAFALAVLVNPANPLSKLTLKQLDGIFAAQRNGYIDKALVWHEAKDHTKADNLRTWGQLGLTGEWADKPIRPHGYPTTSWAENDACMGAAVFFREKVFGGGDKWNPDLVEHERGEEIAAAVAADPYAIGYTSLAYAAQGVKAVALAGAAQSDAVAATPASVASRAYPLTRSLYIYIDRDPKGPVDPKVKEFLRYILSRDGQQAIAEEGAYLPLTPAMAAAELAKLD